MSAEDIAAEKTSSGGNFVSGVEEDLNVAVIEDGEDMEKLMEQRFDETLERRDDYEEVPEEQKAAQ